MRRHDRDTSRRSGLDALLGFAAVVLGVIAGAGADLAIATASATFGRRWVFLPLGDVPRLLGAMTAHAGQLSTAYPTEQRQLLAANCTLWRCIALALTLYVLLVAALAFLLVPLLIAPPGYERPTRANQMLGVAAVRRSTKRATKTRPYGSFPAAIIP